MTIGFAATYLADGHASFLLAADSRYSAKGMTADMAIKTYSLGLRTGAVAAGNGLSVGAAADLTRSIAEDHNRLSPRDPINFYSVVRLFSYFLNQAERANPWSRGCEVGLAGFLSNGSPVLAKVLTRPSEKTEVCCYAPKQAGSLVVMVGQPDAKEQISSAISRALAAPGPHWMERAVATVAYLCEHEGEPTIGGAPSVAFCPRDGTMYWPFVIINGRTHLRGFDVTESVPPSQAKDALNLQYDEAWHSEVDRERRTPPVKLDEGFLGISRYLEDWVAPDQVFRWNLDPESFRPAPDLTLAPAVIVLVRSGEVAGLPSLTAGQPG